MQERAGGRAELAVADRVGDVGDDGHRFVLRRPDLLDQRGVRGPRRLDLREPVVEAVVLAQDLRDRDLVLRQEREVREVHLPRERVLALLRETHELVGLVEQLALLRRVDERLQAHERHRDEHRSDDQERGEQLRVHRRADARDPAHEQAQRRPALDELGELFDLDFRGLLRR